MLLVLTLSVCCCALLKLYTCTFVFKNYFVASTFSFKWNKEIPNNNNHHNHSNSHDNEMVIKRKPLT